MHSIRSWCGLRESDIDARVLFLYENRCWNRSSPFCIRESFWKKSLEVIQSLKQTVGDEKRKAREEIRILNFRNGFSRNFAIIRVPCHYLASDLKYRARVIWTIILEIDSIDHHQQCHHHHIIFIINILYFILLVELVCQTALLRFLWNLAGGLIKLVFHSSWPFL